MNIIKENTSSFEYKEGEEIELDIGSLNNKTLWQLNSFLIAHSVKVGSESPDSRVFINKVGFVHTDGCSPARGVLCSEGLFPLLRRSAVSA